MREGTSSEKATASTAEATISIQKLMTSVRMAAARKAPDTVRSEVASTRTRRLGRRSAITPPKGVVSRDASPKAIVTAPSPVFDPDSSRASRPVATIWAKMARK